MKILVTNANTRIGIEIIRSLGSNGFDITGSSAIRKALGFYSKYCASSLVYPSIEKLENFQNFLLNKLRSNNFDFFVPSTEVMITAIRPIRNQIENYTKVVLPHEDNLQIGFDKIKTFILLENSNLSSNLPKTFIDLRNIKEKDFPIIIKPSKTTVISENKIKSQHFLRIVKNKQDFTSAIREYRRNIRSRPLAQEYIPGIGHGYFAICKDGKVCNDFSHKRIREYPVQGGPSSYRKSYRNDNLTLISKEIISKINWTGIIMLEYRLDERDNKFKLLEINGRFWGSLKLAISSGVNFPFLYIRMLQKQVLKQNKNYEIGIGTRLIEEDIKHLSNLINNKDINSIKAWFFFPRRDFFDYLSFDDPRPGIQYIKNISKKFIKSILLQ